MTDLLTEDLELVAQRVAQLVTAQAVAPASHPDLSPREVARLAGVAYHTVLREIDRGRLRAYRRPGNRLAIRRDDYEAWAYGQPVVPTERPAPVEPPTQRSRRRPARGSVAALKAIERRGAA